MSTCPLCSSHTFVVQSLRRDVILTYRNIRGRENMKHWGKEGSLSATRLEHLHLRKKLGSYLSWRAGTRLNSKMKKWERDIQWQSVPCSLMRANNLRAFQPRQWQQKPNHVFSWARPSSWDRQWDTKLSFLFFLGYRETLHIYCSAAFHVSSCPCAQAQNVLKKIASLKIIAEDDV